MENSLLLLLWAVKDIVMPCGLANAPATFQNMIFEVPLKFLDQEVEVYRHDILIYSGSQGEHQMLVAKVLQWLQNEKLAVSPKPSVFHIREVIFLDYLISDNRVSMSLSKMQSVLRWESLKKVHNVQFFIGFANEYRLFMKIFSVFVILLTFLT